jgi:hypothetical protein
MPTARYKRYESSQWVEYKFGAYDSDKLGGQLPSHYSIVGHGHGASDITQSSSYRFVTDTEKSTWNGKQDALGFTPLNVDGGTLSGRLVLHDAFTSNLAPLNLPGVGTTDPTSLSNGDVWHRSNLLYVRLNGTTRTIYHSGNAATAALTTATQAEMEAGSATTVRGMTPQRVKQATAYKQLIITANITLVLSDAYQFIIVSSSSNLTMTVPLNSSVTFATDTEITFLRYGTGTVTFAATSGVTIRSEGGKLKINAQYQAVTLKKIGTDEWVLIGAVAS